MKHILFFILLVVGFIWFLKLHSVEKIYHTCDWEVVDFGGSLDGNDLWSTRCKHGHKGSYWCYACGDIEGDTIRNRKDLIEVK